MRNVTDRSAIHAPGRMPLRRWHRGHGGDGARAGVYLRRTCRIPPRGPEAGLRAREMHGRSRDPDAAIERRQLAWACSGGTGSASSSVNTTSSHAVTQFPAPTARARATEQQAELRQRWARTQAHIAKDLNDSTTRFGRLHAEKDPELAAARQLSETANWQRDFAKRELDRYRHMTYPGYLRRLVTG
jgi:hypothetical protein